MSEHEDILQAVYQVILQRKANPGENSYTSSLMQKGIDSILKKIGEEATEVVIASKGGNPAEIIHETSDLIFHLLIMLGYHNIPPAAVYEELSRRFGTSGLAEKASRSRHISNP